MKIILATNNKGKLAELSALLKPYHFDVIAQANTDIPSPPETGKTFIENALIKARHATTISGLPAIADDSGLVVPALGGEPGVYSARYAGPSADANANNDKLLSVMRALPDVNPAAYFYCAMVYMQHENDPTPLIAIGKWHGTISTQRTGHEGFGYDPIFYLPELHSTAAELSKDIKNKLSHRGQAMRALINLMREQLAL